MTSTWDVGYSHTTEGTALDDMAEDFCRHYRDIFLDLHLAVASRCQQVSLGTMRLSSATSDGYLGEVQGPA